MVGPNGGTYSPTGGVDAAGNPIYRNGDKYYSFGKDGKIVAANPSPNAARQSEIDVGQELPADTKSQPSFKDGEEVPPKTPGCVKPDFCSGDMASWSVEVKNYDLSRPGGENDLITVVSKQAIDRAEHLPAGMEQQVVIDVRGQVVSPQQEDRIIKAIVVKSGGAIDSGSVQFKR